MSDTDSLHEGHNNTLRPGGFTSDLSWPKPWYKQKRFLISVGGVLLFIILVVALAAASVVGGTGFCPECSCEDPTAKAVSGAPRPPPRPKPASMCAGGEVGGVLRRLSREAYEYWASVNAAPEYSLVVMLADGYGPAIHTMARDVKRSLTGEKWAHLALDGHLVGSSFTTSLVTTTTDSAAGATAYSTGHKTYNGAIGVAPTPQANNTLCDLSTGGQLGVPGGGACAEPRGDEACCPVQRLANLMEGCKAQGMATGLVVTTLIPHATPASWSSHSLSRNHYEFIVQQQLEADPPFDVMLGGGKSLFDARRKDGRDLLAEHSDTYTIVTDAAGLEAEAARSGAVQKPLLGLFADGNMMLDVDRQRAPEATREPSLRDMTRVALRRLKATGKKFCLLVEGSRIDQALHNDDAIGAAHDALAYDEAFKEVLSEVEADSGVQLLGVADHSTGGVTLGYQEKWDIAYGNEQCPPDSPCFATWAHPAKKWDPRLVAHATMSTGRMAARLCCDTALRGGGDAALAFIQTHMGVGPDEAETERLRNASARLLEGYECPDALAQGDEVYLHACGLETQLVLNRLLERSAGIALTTSYHTAEDIHVYAAGTRKTDFLGARENYEFGQAHLKLLGADLAPITEALNECAVPVAPPKR